MKLAFSTLGCPDWDVPQIAQTAQRLGYEGVELRAVSGSLNLLERPEFSSAQIRKTLGEFANRNVEVCCVDTSCTFHSRDQRERDAQVDIAVAHAEIAAALRAPLIRVFPDTIQAGTTREETRDYIVESLIEIAQRLPDGVAVALETHGDFAKSESALDVVSRVNHPQVKLVWDVANSVAAGDSIEQASQMVQPYLSHIHLRDAKPVAGAEHWLPVLAGTGNVSFEKTLKAISILNYSGYISFEWEKYWRPEIENPEVALPHFIKAIRKLQRDTTKCSGAGK